MIRTLAELFYGALAHDLPDALAYRHKGRYQGISHRELQAQVERLCLGLQARGLTAGDRVALLSENRPEWAMLDFGCTLLGLVSVPVYHTLGADQAAYILRHSGARWVLCQNQDQLDKVLATWESLPDLEAVLLLDGRAPRGCSRKVIRWKDLLAEGEAREAQRPAIREEASRRQPGDLATLIYTSGTTGDPKGAMLTHGNLVSNILAALEAIPLQRGECCLSLLPLSHIFERMAGHFTMLHAGVRIHYAESLNLLAQCMLEVKPHILLAVPRVFEKLYVRIRDTVSAASLPRRIAFKAAKGLGRRVSPTLFKGGTPSGAMGLALRLADRVVFQRIRERTGGRLRLAISGGAALDPRLMRFFWAVGIPILEGYGLSETSPILAVNRFGEVAPGTVGRPLYDQWEGRPFLRLSEAGEVLCQGPGITQGYWGDEAATRAAFTEDGYFRTGDIGAFDEAGRLIITDRMKELLVTSGGKNVAPQPIETLLRSDAFLEQVFLVGDHRPFVTALVVPDFHILRRWADHRHLPFSSDAELVALREVRVMLMGRVQHLNQRLAPFEQVKKIHVLDRELTAEAGFLTPSMKPRRRVILRHFEDAIERLYEGSCVPVEA